MAWGARACGRWAVGGRSRLGGDRGRLWALRMGVSLEGPGGGARSLLEGGQSRLTRLCGGGEGASGR